MRALIFITCLFASALAFAGASVSLVPHMTMRGARGGGLIGLSVDQQITGPYFFNLWTGMGTRPVGMESVKNWGAFKLSLEQRISSYTFGAGVAANNTEEELSEIPQKFGGKDTEGSVFLKMSYKIW